MSGSRLLVVGLSTLGLLPLLWACADGPQKPPADDPAASPSVSEGPAPAEAAETFVLEPGRPMLREFGAREVHEYPLALEAEQYVRVVVEQQGVDVVSTLLDPDGRKVLEVDAPTGDRGSEEILAVAAVPGSYVLRIRTWNRDATGTYTVTLSELRKSSNEDRRRVRAALAFARAEEMRRRGGEAIDAAIDAYHDALDQFRRLENREGEAETLRSLGWVYREHLNRPAEASTYYQKAFPIFQELGDTSRQAAVAYFAGVMEARQGHLDSALEWLQQALALCETSGDLAEQASTVALRLGVVNERLGRVQEALGFFESAVDAWRNLGESADLASALYYRGQLFLDLGKHEEARDDFDRTLEIRRRLEDPLEQSWALIAIGRVYHSTQDDRRALEYFQTAGELLRHLDHRLGRAILKNDLGLTYLRLGNLAEARDSFREALDIYHQLGDSFAEAIVLHNLGLVEDSVGKPCDALSFFRQALSLFGQVFGQVPTTYRQASTLLQIATAERQCGDLGRARQQFELALDAVEMVRSQPNSLDLRASYFATKYRFFEAYVDLLMELHAIDPSAGHDVEALAASERARARSLLDSLIESGTVLRRGAAPELIRREQELSRRLADVEADPFPAAGEQGELSSPQDTVQRKVRRRALLRELDEVRGRIRAESPRYAAVAEPRPLSAEEIQEQVLDPKTLLLEYDLGDERSYLWAVTRKTVRSFTLPGRAELESLARRTYRLLTLSKERRSRIRSEMLLSELSNLLLGPVASELGERRLLIVNEGALQYIPFGALYRPCPSSVTEVSDGCSAEPLVVRHEIVTMPSASAVAVLRHQHSGRQPAPRSLAVIADPVFQPHDPRIGARGTRPTKDGTRTRGEIELDTSKFERLAYSGEEAEAILRQAPVGETKAFLGFAATREAIVDGNLGEYRMLHLATHGVLDEEHPELSRLVMSLVDEDGRPRDNGFVFGHEIYNLELPVELVVLSACETALGKNVKGEGIVGLTQGFLYAGAARVIVSLWNVNDRATADLMARFYWHLFEGGQSPSAALRAAQVDLWREMPAPYYWAGFVMQGEWRQKVSGDF